jgi:hypothetical protein
MLTWITYIEPREAQKFLGLIPSFLDEADPRPAAQQISANYIGGWDTMHGFEMDGEMRLCYPADPPLEPIATTKIRNELITVYPYGWVAVCQIEDGTFEVARCD